MLLIIIRPGGSTAFDEELYLNFTILPYLDIPDTTGDYIWTKFQPVFDRVHMVYQYLPVFRKYYQTMFDKLYADGVIRWEIRTSLEGVYNEQGKVYSQEDTLQIVLDELEAWKSIDYEVRKIFSFGIIIQGIRSASVEEVTASLVNAYKLRENFPEIIVGFDLVGHEDPVGHANAITI